MTLFGFDLDAACISVAEVEYHLHLTCHDGPGKVTMVMVQKTDTELFDAVRAWAVAAGKLPS